MITDNLNIAIGYINTAKKLLEANPEKDLVAALIILCRGIDANYKEMCENLVEYNGYDEGLYDGEFGPNIEFNVEADYWHEISLILRKIKL